MKRISMILTIGTVIGGAAYAQEGNAAPAVHAKVLAENITTGMMQRIKFGMAGETVKGAPYAADGVTETTQTLGDGTHINRQETYTIYRDGDGRIRRESGDQVWIFDPVSNASYVLNMKQQTARKISLSRDVAYQKMQLDDHTVKLRAEAGANQIFFAAGAVNTAAQPPKTEPLGRQSMEGVDVDGTRTTIELPQGQIGNDRAIQIVTERWASSELQITVMSKHTDPIMGDTTERLTNIRRGEPNASLFQVPAGFNMESLPVKEGPPQK
jgi:hypothetical protein